jgi:rRNA maturation RNase YbeY
MKQLVAREKVEKQLRTASRRILALLHKKGSVELFLIEEKEMKKLRDRFFKVKRGEAHLNVLAFPEPRGFPHPELHERLWGEMYLNWERYQKVPSELLFLTLHGILHLVGYDHQRRSDMINMEKLEKRLWPHISSLV